MQPRIPWVEMRWSFELPPSWFPLVLERLRGTPARARALLAEVPEDRARARVGEGWSIIENVGHLTDVEPLWEGRLDDYEAALPEVRPADMSNTDTWSKGHNERAPAEVLDAFARVRAAFVMRLESWGGDDRWARSAHHARLNRPMRVIDLAQFVADHDDYHMARIHQMKRDAGLTA